MKRHYVLPLRTKVRDSLAIYPFSLSQQPYNRNKSVIPTPCAKRREAKWVDGIIANHLVHLPLLLQRGGTHRRRHLKHPITATKKASFCRSKNWCMSSLKEKAPLQLQCHALFCQTPRKRQEKADTKYQKLKVDLIVQTVGGKK